MKLAFCMAVRLTLISNLHPLWALPLAIHASSRLPSNDQRYHAFAVAYSSVILNFSVASSSAAVRINHSAAHRCFQNDHVGNLR